MDSGDVFAVTPALIKDPVFQAVLRKVESVGISEPVATLRLCLQALIIQEEELKPRLLNAELVATIPSESPGIARPTARVVREMIEGSSEEIILVGYEMNDEVVMRLVATARARGVDAIVICDRNRGVAERIHATWPVDIPRPKIFHDRERSHAGPYASMHAKCLLVDGSNLLITSANFTFHGLRENIEIGVRLSGWPAHEARKMLSYLVENQLVEEQIR